MDKKEIEAFARKAAKGIKTEKDLSNFSQLLFLLSNTSKFLSIYQ